MKGIIPILVILGLIFGIVAISGCTDSGTNTSTSDASGVQIKVNSSGSWSGSYGDESGQQSIDGTGSKTITMEGNPSIVSATFQKQSGGSGKLTVSIIKDGSVLETKSTTAAYGVVSVSTSL